MKRKSGMTDTSRRVTCIDGSGLAVFDKYTVGVVRTFDGFVRVYAQEDVAKHTWSEFSIVLDGVQYHRQIDGKRYSRTYLATLASRFAIEMQAIAKAEQRRRERR